MEASGNFGRAGMINKILPKTFRYRMILYNLLVIISIASAVSFYNYDIYRNDVIDSATENSINCMKTLSDRTDVAYSEMVNIILNCAERKSLFLTTVSKDYQSERENNMTLDAATVLRDFCAISGYKEYIDKITLYNKDTLLLQAGTSPGSSNDVEAIMNAAWFHDFLYRNTAEYTLSLEENPFILGRSSNSYILPLIRPLQYNQGQRPEDAWVFLGISPKLFDSVLQSLVKEQIIYAITREGDMIASLNVGQYETAALIDQLLTLENMEGNFRTQLNGDDCIITYQKQVRSGVLFFEILPVKAMNVDHGIVGRTIMIIFFSCIGLGLFLSYLISCQLSAPISRLTKRLELVSKGDFKRDPGIETQDEIGMIGIQINQMSERISNLMDTRIKNENEKKNMEINMLQAQINPHFLYNTLDSIKWIATMQKNSGIVQIVVALSSLLKNMAKGFNEKVTLRQELNFLLNYVTIEKIRYIELFDVEIDVESESLYEAKIIKLTLQPIVENAIFNGIEPSGRTGLISIRAFAKQGVLYITVTDNGIGISPDNIEKLLTDTERITRSNMSGIGLPNVDRRLKLVYGEAYGITIDSLLDQYTTITIALPLEI